jgi:hypothetical protein
MRKDKTRVGYRQPPVHTRFQPGKSGNPRGRPKASKDIQARLKKAAAQKVVVQEGGKQRKVDKLDLAMTQLMNGAAQGKPALLKMALAQIQNAELAEPSTTSQDDFADTDREVIALVVSRIRAMGGDA